jgi:hypothetical protein
MSCTILQMLKKLCRAIGLSNKGLHAPVVPVGAFNQGLEGLRGRCKRYQAIQTPFCLELKEKSFVLAIFAGPVDYLFIIAQNAFKGM